MAQLLYLIKAKDIWTCCHWILQSSLAMATKTYITIPNAAFRDKATVPALFIQHGINSDLWYDINRAHIDAMESAKDKAFMYEVLISIFLCFPCIFAYEEYVFQRAYVEDMRR
jgi:hypothetical protein